MARVFTDGAEMGDTLFFDTPTNISNVTSGTTTPRSGNRCYQTGAQSSTNKTVPDQSEYYIRFGIKTAGFSSTNILIKWKNSGTDLGRLEINNATDLLSIVIGSTYVATGTKVFLTNTWYLIELHVKIDNSVGIATVKVDGVQDANYSGDTQPGSATTINQFWFGSTGLQNWSLYLDDLALNDTTGPHDNEWCGDGRITLVSPRADGDNIQLTRGGTDSGANWSQVDEIPSNSDTDYVESLTAGQYDLYKVIPMGALAAGETIQRVFVGARIRETTAAGDSINLGISYSGMISWAENMPTSTTYSKFTTSGWIVNPYTNTAWTFNTVSGLQIGMKIV